MPDIEPPFIGGREHPGCRYYAAHLDGGWFCNKCGWGAADEPPFISAAELLADIRGRIERGVGQLEASRRRMSSEHEQARLAAKADGLRSVLDMLRAYDGPQLRAERSVPDA